MQKKIGIIVISALSITIGAQFINVINIDKLNEQKARVDQIAVEQHTLTEEVEVSIDTDIIPEAAVGSIGLIEVNQSTGPNDSTQVDQETQDNVKSTPVISQVEASNEDTESNEALSVFEKVMVTIYEGKISSAAAVPSVDNASVITRTEINVKAYGAKGDGITDDTAAIQAAFTAAKGTNKIVEIPAGNYRTTKSLTATGSNYNINLQSGAIIKSENIRNRPVINIVNATNVHLSGQGIIIGDYTGNIYDKLQGIVTFDTSRDSSVMGITIKESRHMAVVMTDSANVVAKNLTIYNEYCGIQDTRGLNNKIIANKIVRTSAAQEATNGGNDRGIRGSETKNLKIEGNKVVNFSLAIELYHDTKGVVISNNMILGTGFGISLDRGDDSIVSYNTISGRGISTPFRIGIELAESHNVTVIGNIIKIPSGIYQGNGIAVWNAENGSGSASDGAKISKNIIEGVEFGIAITGATNISANNNRITDTEIGIEMAEYKGKNITISGNILLNQTSFGIRLPGNRGFSNVIISQNTIKYSGDVSIMLSQSINVTTGDIDNANVDINVVGNHVLGTQGRGIYAILTDGSITDNTVEKSTKSGIYFWGADATGHVVIENNKVIDCSTKSGYSEAGIYVTEIPKNMTVTVLGNLISGTVHGKDLFIYNVKGTVIQ